MNRLTSALFSAVFLLGFSVPASGGYATLNDGSTLDTDTGLAWQTSAPSQPMDWKDALAYCSNLTLGGHDDWRLPNIRELHSLLDYSRHMPAVDPRFYAAYEYNSYHWSSSPYLGSASSVHVVNLYYGSFFGYSKTSTLLLRCVRDGALPAANATIPILLLDE